MKFFIGAVLCSASGFLAAHFGMSVGQYAAVATLILIGNTLIQQAIKSCR